jgi:hypothetical protein
MPRLAFPLFGLQATAAIGSTAGMILVALVALVLFVWTMFQSLSK